MAGLRGRRCAIVWLCAGAAPVWGAPVAPQAPSTGTPTLQQSFDQATTAASRQDCATALPIFERLATDPRIKPGSLPAGTIAVRRGICLADDRRYDEAELQIGAGLPVLRAAGPDMAGDVADAELALGDIAAAHRDHDGAIAHYQSGLAMGQDAPRSQMLVRLAQVTQFDGDDAPLAALDEAQHLIEAAPRPDRHSLQVIHTLRGRVFLDRGRNKEALAELKTALALSGGLTDRVSVADASMRGDLAEAFLLNGQKDEARNYLAYTGAGRIAASPFAVPATMTPPQCGPETGLSPTDSAIVEFGIDDRGDVSAASTVYTRGDYRIASAFAQAVEHWYWRPEDLAKIPAFYKVLTRVELRCSATGGDLPGVVTPLHDRFAAWAGPHLDDADTSATKIGTDLERLGVKAKQREAANDLPGAIAALTMRGLRNPKAGVGLPDFDHALALADGAHLPDQALDAILVFRYASYLSIPHGAAAQALLGVRSRIAPITAKSIVETHPAIAGDAVAFDTMTILAQPAIPAAAQRADVEAALRRVAGDDRLATHHPLRQLASLRLANLAAASGDIAAAQGYFADTGLSEEQCALIGAHPAVRSTGAGSNDFPSDALRYGFEGWVRLEYDINTAGTTANIRPLIAYPPFVFVDAATGLARNIRYDASYRPSNSVACSAEQQTVNFVIPSNH